jgi:hypothetical protein
MNLHEQFASWLAAQTAEPFVYQVKNDHCTVIRVPKNAAFDYLYCQSRYRALSAGKNLTTPGFITGQAGKFTTRNMTCGRWASWRASCGGLGGKIGKYLDTAV